MHSRKTILDTVKNECLRRKKLKNIPFIHYFSNEFMERNTQYFCIEDFLSSIGITDISTLDHIDQAMWDTAVNQTTVFKNWDEMLSIAGSEYYQLNMHEGLAN